MKQRKRFDKLVVLDLDETLIYASDTPLERAPDFRLYEYYVYKRPHVDAFLAACLEWFQVAVWSAGTPGYVYMVAAQLFGDIRRLEFIFACDRCTKRYDHELRTEYLVKNLRKVVRRGYPREKVLIIDDLPKVFRLNYGNGIRVDAFTGDPEDVELPALLRFLEHLGPVDDVRPIEKRGWRTVSRP